jgi:hypothetical protein
MGVRRLALMVCVVSLAGAAWAQAGQAAVWTQQQVPAPQGPNGMLSAVTCAGPRTCTAVGYFINPLGEQRAMAERWNGSAWALQPVPAPAGARFSYLDAVSCTSANACMAVGASRTSFARQEPFSARWNGASWTVHPVPVPPGGQGGVLNGVSCTSSSACTAVGSLLPGEHSMALSERWNGTNWELETSVTPAGATEAALNAVACTGPSSCEAVGGYTTANPALYPTKTFAEAWNGAKWALQTTAPLPSGAKGGLLAGVSCPAANACAAVGGYTTAGSQGPDATLAERWNGTKWVREATPDPAGGNFTTLRSVSCAGSTSCVATLSPSALVPAPVVERWNGTSWSIHGLVKPPGKAFAVIGVACTEATNCIAVGGSGLQHLYATWAEHLNGSSWKLESTPNETGAAEGSLAGVSCAGGSWCAAVGTGTRGPAGPTGPTADGWNGSKWTLETVPSPAGAKSSGLAGVSCNSSSACMAVGEWTSAAGVKHPLAARWDSHHWALETVPDPSGATGASLAGVSCTAAGACTAVGDYTTGGGEKTLAERWNGTGWAVVSTPNPSGAARSVLAAVSCATQCWAVGSSTSAGNAAALAELWNGASWEIKPTADIPGVHASIFTSVSCTAATACTAVGGYATKTSGGTLAERWDGTRWVKQTAPNPDGGPFAGVSCGAARACTGVGGLFAAAWDGVSWSEQSPPYGGHGGEFFGVTCTAAAACTLVGSFDIPAIIENIFVDSFTLSSFDLPLADRYSAA